MCQENNQSMRKHEQPRVSWDLLGKSVGRSRCEDDFKFTAKRTFFFKKKKSSLKKLFEKLTQCSVE